jgi:DNA (cytosine-5)-methyltransferase 1
MTGYLSVCSGIEAATVAWHSLGWEPLAFSEIEAFPSAVLAHHYPTVPNLGDMTKYSDWDIDLLADVDVLVGGTPCQAFSVAGLREGLEDERGQLTITYIKLLDYIDDLRSLYGKQPAICVWENVPGVLSSKDNAFGAFLGGLAGEDCELVPSGGKWTDAGCVYGPKRSVAWRVLDAQYFGVAQRRKRVFVIASARDIDPSEILFEFDGVRRDTPPSRETGKGSTEAVGRGSTFQDTPILNDQGGSVMGVEDGLVGTLRRETHGHEPIVFSIIADPTPKVGDDICLTMRSQGGGEIVPPSVATYQEVVGALCNCDHKGVGSQYVEQDEVICIPIHDKATRHGGERGVSNGLGIGSPTDPCPTLDTGGNHAVAFDAYNQTTDEVFMTLRADKADNDHIPTVYPPTMQVRRLTPTECEALQGFPRNWTDVPYRNKPAADSPRYKALGNSMAVPCMVWLGRRIHDAIRLG